MKKKIKSITFLISVFIYFLLIATTCNKEDVNCHKHILIVNNSYNAIYFDYSLNYPDTITLYPNPSLDPDYFKIEGNSSKKDIYRDCIEDNLLTNPEETIMYFIYDAHTLETIPWDTVVKNYMILKRYDLHLEDLQAMDWIITYP